MPQQPKYAAACCTACMHAAARAPWRTVPVRVVLYCTVASRQHGGVGRGQGGGWCWAFLVAFLRPPPARPAGGGGKNKAPPQHVHSFLKHTPFGSCHYSSLYAQRRALTLINANSSFLSSTLFHSGWVWTTSCLLSSFSSFPQLILDAC